MVITQWFIVAVNNGQAVNFGLIYLTLDMPGKYNATSVMSYSFQHFYSTVQVVACINSSSSYSVTLRTE
eukprot:Pgem_evm2s11038